MRRILLIVALFAACVATAQQHDTLTLLHTNDTHSCIEPERDGGAGVLNRALLLEELRDSLGADNVLLFDCGDFSQGSLYYNTFRGAMEVELMNAMGYDACTIGNHEFDYGMEQFMKLAESAQFPYVAANFCDLEGNPVLEGYVILP